ncbi:hypothetical protein [Marinospirillum alkaliphilum]|uniref:Outer membrane protein beta-barrel domain-containing protein n=1 Tax=Marinospirillum alkaliphilum DSM 21637 TaxID=1122209 RepID=A0A1K1ZLE0_9GAMM|nr:hypothetical protein [Marinospirillum alkaliphilum]SFX74492.1 hypothetical protein SAMN02745752_02722 [Marinospirillum alkaliphilum DSM 21637]
MVFRIKALLIALLLLATGLAATAAEARTSHAFGFDALRYLDQAQDGDQFNLSWQMSTGRRSALVFGVADGDNYQMYEAGFKRYNERYLSGSFYQLGASYWNGDTGYKNDFGLDLRVGYEIPITRWAVVSGAISTLYGIDTPQNKDSYSLVFRPHMSLLIHF